MLEIESKSKEEQVKRKLDAEAITAALEAGGKVAQRLPHYEKRQAQIDLMRLIIRGFNEDAIVAAEAGTGVGKSFAYLLPALSYALLNNERIVISTATITLQQQLFEKDIPLVVSALGKKVKAVLVKGRGNYLCRRRLDDAIKEGGLLDERENDDLAAIVEWAETAKTGSLSDLPFVPVPGLWSRVCSESDSCMGGRCPEKARCFVLALRAEAASAAILVANHHLLFADLAARSQGAGYETSVVLPPYDRVVIDEAHAVEESVTSLFSEEFGKIGLFHQLGRLYRNRRGKRSGLLLKILSIISPDIADFDQKCYEIEDKIQRMKENAEDLDAAGLSLCLNDGFFRLTEDKEALVWDKLDLYLANLRVQIASFVKMVKDMAENSSLDEDEGTAIWEVKGAIRRIEAIGGICADFAAFKTHPDKVMWIERQGKQNDIWARFIVTPLDTAAVLQNALFEPNKTVICVSATLTVAGNFGYWGSRCGLGGASGGPDSGASRGIVRTPVPASRTASGFGANHGIARDTVPASRPASASGAGRPSSMGRPVLTGVFPSPFPYKSSVLLAVPKDAPFPNEEAFRGFVDRLVPRLVMAAGGSGLLLFTSYESLKSAYAAARPLLEARGIRCLKQGDDDRTRLLQTFLADEKSTLFATDSFWEGVDAPGDTLRLVIICKLPFRAPSEPVFEARCELLEKNGGNPFMDISVPEAVMKF
jgi:ATP-dependent DNA helicase DinG